MDKPVSTANAFQLRPREDAVPETVLQIPARSGSERTDVRPTTSVDLSGKPKVWFAIGRGNVGKTTLLRWAAEVVETRGGQVVCAAVDPVNRTLRAYRDGVGEPRSSEPDDVRDFLGDLIQQMMEDRQSALVDLGGGGDSSLHRLLMTIPDLTTVMEESGVVPVAMHVTGSDPHDLTPLAMMEAAGFRPRATAIVCNLRGGVRDDFSRVLRHSVLRAAQERGAIQLWMPALNKDAARQVDARCLQYHHVDQHLGPFARASVRMWLNGMAEEFAPIKSWLP